MKTMSTVNVGQELTVFANTTSKPDVKQIVNELIKNFGGQNEMSVDWIAMMNEADILKDSINDIFCFNQSVYCADNLSLNK